LQPFKPIVRNPHLLTIFGNFARRRLDLERFPIHTRLFSIEQGVQVLVHSQYPETATAGEILTVHGLEGSSNAGYLRSFAQLALENGYAVHRKNMRSCGGTINLCSSMYHAGLTSDTLAILRELKSQRDIPLYLIGYSLGGNVALKLAGELGEAAVGLLDGVIGVSVPIDLAACVRELRKPKNRIYEWRFLLALRQRIRQMAALNPGVHALDKLSRVRSVYDFDDAFVAPYFGFGSADNYYATQSSVRFLSSIRVPALILQAKDDPMIPFDIFGDPRLRDNPNIELIPVEHGGHLGFIADAAPRFWADRVILKWITQSRDHRSESTASRT
jgi:predicted alpha/beta-fold hydrolase